MDWIDAVEAAIGKQSPTRAAWLRERVYGETRNVWALFANLAADDEVLILGTEWGTSAAAISKIVRAVTVIPAFAESVSIIKSRLAREHLYGVTLLEPGVALPLPFHDESFDAAIIYDLRWGWSTRDVYLPVGKGFVIDSPSVWTHTFVG